MAKTTPLYGLTYAEPGDEMDDWPAVSQDVATDLDNLLGTRTRITDMFTAAAGWTINTQQVDFCGPLIFIYLIFTRIGAAISVPADGNPTNVAAATFDNTAYVFMTYGPLVSSVDGRLAAWSIAGPTLSLTATTPGAPIATNDKLSCRGLGLMTPGHQLIP